MNNLPLSARPDAIPLKPLGEKQDPEVLKRIMPGLAAVTTELFVKFVAEHQPTTTEIELANAG